MKKLAIITTHPIQYYAPVFKLLAQKADIKVFYTAGGAPQKPQFEPGFGREIKWDIPLLEGYSHEFIENTAKKPGTDRFNAIVNPTLLAKISSYKPDAILVYGWAYRSHLSVLRHFKGIIPLWFRGDSTTPTVANRIKLVFRKAFLKWVYQHVDKAFYVGSANKEYFLQSGLQEEQLLFAPHAVDNERFSKERGFEVRTFQQSIHFESDEIIILFVGKLDINKRPDLLLTTFMDLNLYKTHLVFVGDGPLKKDLKLKSSQHSRIHFLDFQNQNLLPVFYQASDLICLPSLHETWGLAINEAMAAGNAVLASSTVGCASDLICEGLNGEIFQYDCPLSLRQKLVQMTQSKKRLQEMGVKSKLIISEWNFNKQTAAILNELNAIY